MKSGIITVVFAIIVSAIACTKGGEPETVTGNAYAVTSSASSKQLIPIIDTTSTGTFTGFYDEQANNLTFSLSWNDLWRDTRRDTIISISFYGPAAVTANGTLVRALLIVNTNRIGSVNLGLAGNTGFSETEKKDFLAGAYYFTINTRRYPTGIIRGQLAVTKR